MNSFIFTYVGQETAWIRVSISFLCRRPRAAQLLLDGNILPKISQWYLCQDETRLGLKTIAGRLITARGVKPVGLSQWQRQNFYLYGVVEPLSGYSFFYEFPYLNGDCFQRFLELLSADLGDDIAVIQFDQGSFHKAKALDCLDNIIPIFQPPHSPELNPIEP